VSAPDSRTIPVQIQGQRYPIRTTLDAQYVARLAAFVDEKMRVAADTAPASDSLRVAVLAALNIADELFRLSEARDSRDGQLVERTEALERLLDSVLAS
jgi:cell division protein ZapA